MMRRRWDDPVAGWLDRARRRFYRWYYHLKYIPFAAQRRARVPIPRAVERGGAYR